MLRRLLCFSFVFALLASPVFADQAVTDWNWLQLPPSDVTAFIGSTSGGGSGYGEPADFRWGDHVWIPDGTLTNSGAGDYFAGVRFTDLYGQHEVENVRIQWWANEGTSIKSGTVQGSTDGVNFSDIGTFDFGVFTTGQRFFSNVDVTDGNYSHVRVRMQSGEYAFGSASRGGPGIYRRFPRSLRN